MKKCKRCLLENANVAVYCVNCGAKLTQDEDEAQEAQSTVELTAQDSFNASDETDSVYVYETAGYQESAASEMPTQEPEFVEATVEDVESRGEWVDGDVPNPSPSPSSHVSSMNALSEMSCEGILSQAWHDVRSSQGWFGKSALLALISLVPILNFVVVGYCLRWARLASFKHASNKPMPSVAINGDYFKIGFFSAVIMFCWSVAVGIVNAIPVIGFVGNIAAILAIPMLYMGVQRMNLLNNLGSAFSFKDIWEKYRRNFGGAMALAWLPTLLVVAVVLIMAVAISLVFGISFMGIYSGGYVLHALGIIGIVVALVACYVAFMASVVCNLVVTRAFGYWTQRVAPEWVDETYRAAGMTPPAR